VASVSVSFFQVRRWFCLFFLALLISNCSKQPTVSVDTPLFIEFPKNTHVFYNIGPLLYDACHQHLTQAGFAVTSDPHHAYHLVIHITGLEPQQKNVSPEIILFSYHARLDLRAQIFDHAGKEVFAETLSCSALVGKPKDPAFNDDFIFCAYQRLAERAARLLQQQLLAKLEHIFGPTP